MSSMAYEQTCHPIQWVPLLCWLFNLLYLCTSRFFAPQHWNKTVWVMSCSCCNLQVRFFWLRTVPPNLHLKKLNPNIDLSNFACCIPDWWGEAMHETNRRTGDAKMWNFSIFLPKTWNFWNFRDLPIFSFVGQNRCIVFYNVFNQVLAWHVCTDSHDTDSLFQRMSFTSAIHVSDPRLLVGDLSRFRNHVAQQLFSLVFKERPNKDTES